MGKDYNPFVSVLIVTFNRRQYVERSIASVLGQTYSNLEVIVFDNGSSDDTFHFIKQKYPKIRVIRSKYNLGCPLGRNNGADYCAGDYIYFLDDDGWLEKDAIAFSVNKMLENPKYAVIMSAIHEVNEDGMVRVRAFGKNFEIGTFSGGCSLIKRDIFNKVSRFPEDYWRQGEEEFLSLKILDLGYILVFEPRSIMYHLLEQNESANLMKQYYQLRNSTKTALRLWPFPYYIIRFCRNIFRALFLFGWKKKRILLFVRLMSESLQEILRIHKNRTKVSKDAFLKQRRLIKQAKIYQAANAKIKPSQKQQ